MFGIFPARPYTFAISAGLALLVGASGAAAATEGWFTWGNKPLSDLYQFEHKNMPATNPGSVPPDQLHAITAYILQKNGFPAGKSPLDKSEVSRPLTKN